MQIDHEEYGEALMLAKAYGLDCDLVYQRQWRKTPVSVASIQDYLVNCHLVLYTFCCGTLYEHILFVKKGRRYLWKSLTLVSLRLIST